MSTQDTTLPPLDERAEFEEWCTIELNYGYDFAKDAKGNYTHDATETAWYAWEASAARAAIAAQAQQPAAVKDSLTLEQVEAVADVDDAAYCLLAILQRVGPGATVGQVLAILEQAQQAQGVPAGFKLVPIEPTPEMLACLPTIRGESVEREIWANLLAAAPQAEPQPSYRPDYPNSETVLGAENEKARQDERLFGVGFTVNGWHVPAHLVSKWGKPQAPAASAEPQPEREPLTDAQIEKLREATFSTCNPFCPCDSKSMRKAVRAAERAHGIGTKGGDK